MKKRLIGFLAILSFIISQFASYGALITFSNGAGTGVWGTAGNWTGGVIPATADDGIFDPNVVAIPTTLQINASTTVGGVEFWRTVNNVTLGNGGGTAATLTLSSGSPNPLLVYSNSAGTLTFNKRVGSGTADLSIAVSASGTMNCVGNVILNPVISGAGNISKIGVGTLTLGAANTFTSILKINEGPVAIATINNTSAAGTLGNSANAVQMGASGSVTGTLSYTGSTASSTKTFSLNTGGFGGFDVTSSGTVLTISGIISGAGGLVKTGSGQLTLSGVNTYTGTSAITGGILSISTDTGLGAAPASATAGAVTINGGTLQSSSTGVGSTFISGNRGIAIGASGGTIDIPSSVAVLTYTSGQITGSGNVLTKSGAGTFRNTTPTSTTFTKLLVTGGLYQAATDPIFGAVPASPLSDAITLNGGGISVNAGLTFSANRGITLGASGGIIDGTSAPVCPQIITGSGNLTKNGSGICTLSGANTYTGKTIINSSAQITINNSGGDAALGTAPGSFVADQLTLNGGTLSVGSAANAVLPPNRGVTIGASGGTLNVGSTKNLEVQGVIAGSGALTSSGATGQSVTLSGANTYTGKTSVAGGTLIVSSLNSVSGGTASSSLGHPTTVANGTIAIGTGAGNTTMIYNGPGETSDRVIDMTGTTGNTVIQADGSGALVLTAVNTASANGLKNFTLTGSSTATNTIGKIVDSTAATTINKTGAGTWTLAGANTHTGGTQIGNGLLNFGNANALSSGTFSFTAGGSFDNTTGSDLTVANAMTLSGGSATYVGSANNMTFNGLTSITGANRAFTVTARTLILAGGVGQDGSARGLTKGGNGTLVLQGTSTYTGATTITNGTLRVDGSIASSSSVTVTNGTLSGTGTVPALTVNNNGFVSPGASPGTLTCSGAVTFNSGGNYVWEVNDLNGTIGSAYDTINAASLNIAATTGSKFNIKVTSLSGTSAGQAANFSGTTDYDFTILHTTGGITGSGASAINVDISAFQNTLGNGGFWFVTVGANDIVLSYRRAAFITSNPSSLTLNAGQTANFSGSATGSGSVSYQWKKGASALSNGSQTGGSVVTGATTANLTVTGVTYQDEGAYTLTATGTYGAAAATTAANLTVSDPPVISSPVAASTISANAGTVVNLSVVSTGRPGTYQWKKGGVNLANGAFDNAATVTGSQTANLTLANIRAADAGAYTAAQKNSDGSATSSATTLVVNDPVISVQPDNSTFE
ncbi:MAG: Extracellular serine protease precursor [Verrucomicrobiales bacterium]|nr:Extracellular serine protease precursor [Verrucomicrobiales bacterium]